LAARAQEQGRAQTQFGQGLLGGAFNLASGSYAPLQTQLQQAQGVEALGQSTLDMGAQLGGRTANAAGANALMQGGMAAAGSMASANSYNPMASALQGLGSNQAFGQALSGMFNRPPQQPMAPVSQQASYAPGSANASMQSWFQ
jgi:hypothetical protein